ncbi:MAG TPA: 30S ribosomal protein S17 [Candidatus Cloacimonadota bacterium]|nr:30S ribosomal protein S17 [Candidatus Cloacimonadota bacterium]HPK40550.1 30S ribosomal protein S17 [Candidatus Cloacimonadota bacterium]HPY96910.1 30S ribosomal protein S17 [Candidatus Cloacimonadota bacterium]HQB40441.1 30S ribosomal protein S17 [Candidatus Cloacimonadota bacterium]
MAIERRVKKIGTVVSDKMDKSVVVRVEKHFMHPLYKKVVRKHKKFMAHDETNDCHDGDIVEIRECAPHSRNKRWEIIRVVERSK